MLQKLKTPSTSKETKVTAQDQTTTALRFPVHARPRLERRSRRDVQMEPPVLQEIGVYSHNPQGAKAASQEPTRVIPLVTQTAVLQETEICSCNSQEAKIFAQGIQTATPHEININHNPSRARSTQRPKTCDRTTREIQIARHSLQEHASCSPLQAVPSPKLQELQTPQPRVAYVKDIMLRCPISEVNGTGS